MNNIPIRHINTSIQEALYPEPFTIRDVGDMLAGQDMVQELHRHDFFYILALKKGLGEHEIDFTPYKVGDHSLFFMRPGQVHKLILKSASTGYLIEFTRDFYFATDIESNQLLRKAGTTSFYQPAAKIYKKLHAILTYIFEEYTGKQENYGEVIKANLTILFTELARQHNKMAPGNVAPYMQERLEEF